MKRAKSYGEHSDKVLRTHIELSRALNRLRAKETAWMATHDLTLAQFAILEVLYHLGTLRVGEITKLILSTAGNITVVIKNLEQKGYIRVFAWPEDRRIKMVEITLQGTDLMATLFPKHVQNLTAWYDAGLEENEMETLSRLLRKLEKAQSKAL